MTSITDKTCWMSTVACHSCGEPCATNGKAFWCVKDNCGDAVKKNVHFMSETVEWATPEAFFKRFNDEFNFDVDVCATAQNAKCLRYYTKETDGLAQSWAGDKCWMNPPYGREIGKWVKKAYESSKQGAVVVCLLPARTDTQWWHDYCMNAELRFVRGRLKFGGATNSAPFPSVVVVFRSGVIPNPRSIPANI